MPPLHPPPPSSLTLPPSLGDVAGIPSFMGVLLSWGGLELVSELLQVSGICCWFEPLRQVAMLCLGFSSITFQCQGWHKLGCCKQDQSSSSVSSPSSRPPDTLSAFTKNTDWYSQPHLHTPKIWSVTIPCSGKASFACACCFLAVSAVSCPSSGCPHCSVLRLLSIWLVTWRGRTSRERR